MLGVFLAIYGGQNYWAGNRRGLLWLALGAAISFAFKFDFIPFVAGGVLLLYTVFKKARLQSSKVEGKEQSTMLSSAAYDILLGVGLVFLFFGLLTGFSWPPDSILQAWNTLRAQNQNVIISDQHWLENPLVYLAAVVAGIGLPAVVLAAMGGLKIKLKKLLARPDVCLLVGIVLLEFMVLWSIDTPFVRRANVFMPAVCLAAAYAYQRLRLSPTVISAVLAYTLLLGCLGQSNHWFDTRIAAREWINTQLPAAAVVAATPYAAVKGLRPTSIFQPGAHWDYAVLHESYYHRYGLSVTTPFGYPACCEEVYHCQGETLCQEIQNIIRNQDASVELIARFPTRNWLPERWLYHQLFGNYETFLGDVLVYRRR